MRTASPRTLGWTILPAAGLLVAMWLVMRHAGLPEGFGRTVGVLAGVVFGAGALIGVRFNRTRPALALVALAGAQMVVTRFGGALDAGAPATQAALVATGIIVPASLILLAIVRERGLLTRFGLIRMAILAAPVIGAIGWIRRAPQDVVALGSEPVLGGLDHAVGDPVLIAFGAAALVVGGLWIKRRGPVESGLLGALVAAFVALHHGGQPHVASAWLLTGGLIVALSIIETSYGLAYRDPLTGLPARRALDESMDKLSGRYTVAMVDVDHFKKFNDKYGHDTGDDVLRLVASILGRVSGGGRSFRYGGEEFTVLFPGKTADEARPHLESLRERIAGAQLTLRASDRPKRKPKKGKPKPRGGHKKVSVTASIGFGEAHARECTADEAIKVADKNLYKAKKGGRNKVCG